MRSAGTVMFWIGLLAAELEPTLREKHSTAKLSSVFLSPSGWRRLEARQHVMF